MVINKPTKQSNASRVKKRLFPFKIFFIVSLFTLFVISLTGCITLNDPETSQEYNSDIIGVIDKQTNLGQSLVSRRPNLNSVTLWLTTKSDQPGGTNQSTQSLKLDLYHSLGETVPIYSTSTTVPASAQNTSITIPIPDQKNTAGQPFFILLSTEKGPIQINGRLEDSYPYGQAYANGSQVDADIAFRLTYGYDFSAFVQDLRLYFGEIWIVVPLILLLWLPGWLLVDILNLRTRFDLGEQTAISIGLSLAIIPLIMLWTTVVKLHWSRAAVIVVIGLLVASFILRIFYNRYQQKRNKPEVNGDQVIDGQIVAPRFIDLISNKSFLLMMIFIGSLAIRLIMVRDLATPAWVDSVHHALITRLILENGSFPATYLPYLNLSSTAYHPGFHSVVAFFTWLSYLDLNRSLLILGQVLNAFAVFSVYLLAKTLTQKKTAGLLAAFITGFLTPMPAYYTSWGRYTELTGLLILPIALALIRSWQAQKEDNRTVHVIMLCAIAAGGLFMIHYRVIVFLACLLLAYLVVQLLNTKNENHRRPFKLFLVMIAITGASILIVLPWFIPTVKNLLIPRLATSIESSTAPFADFSWPYLTSALGKQALVLAGLGSVWSLIKKRSLAIFIFIWIFLLFFFANLDVLRLPGSGMLTNISVEIMLFIPIAIFGGYFLEQLFTNWKQLIPFRYSTLFGILMIIIIGFTAYIGAKHLIPILNPVTILTRQADLPAIQWITDHIPQNETIALNPFSWGYGLYAGNDGGYWIEPLSGSFSLPPPVLYGLGPGYKQISQQTQQVISASSNPSALHDYLLSQEIRYIFIGARGGVLPPEKLISSGLFEILYHQEGTWILAVKP